MQAAMIRFNGVGIAAPQIGISKRVIIIASRPTVAYPHAPTIAPLVMINPRILRYAERMQWGYEGCGLFPGYRGKVLRYRSIQVAYTDTEGNTQNTKLTGFLARICQHEMDHLDGVMFIERADLSTLISEKLFLVKMRCENT
jgi:peptide deformylase